MLMTAGQQPHCYSAGHGRENIRLAARASNVALKLGSVSVTASRDHQWSLKIDHF